MGISKKRGSDTCSMIFLIHVFHKGNTLEAYKVFGAHLETNDHKKRVSRFTVYAPNARSVQVVGDFNDWDGQNHYMEKVYRWRNLDFIYSWGKRILLFISTGLKHKILRQ